MTLTVDNDDRDCVKGHSLLRFRFSSLLSLLSSIMLVYCDRYPGHNGTIIYGKWVSNKMYMESVAFPASYCKLSPAFSRYICKDSLCLSVGALANV